MQRTNRWLVEEMRVEEEKNKEIKRHKLTIANDSWV